MESDLIESADAPDRRLASPPAADAPLEVSTKVLLSDSQLRMALWLNALPLRKHTTWFPEVANSHAVIIVRLVQRKRVSLSIGTLASSPFTLGDEVCSDVGPRLFYRTKYMLLYFKRDDRHNQVNSGGYRRSFYSSLPRRMRISATERSATRPCITHSVAWTPPTILQTTLDRSVAGSDQALQYQCLSVKLTYSSPV
jgi:hypothetical protein